MSVHSKLNEARMKLQSTKLNKSGQNKFAGYTYFELGDFLPTVNQIFSDLGLCGVVSYGTELATLTITDVDDNSSISITSPMKEANLKGCHPIQNLGAVETYTRRYLWVTALEIVEHDALDATTGKEDRKEAINKGKTLPPNESGKAITKDVWDNLPIEEQMFLNDIAIEIVDAYTKNNLDECCRLFYKNNLDQDEQTALWSRFDSKQRSAIKAHNEQLRKVA
jgi:hypothetical protein